MEGGGYSSYGGIITPTGGGDGHILMPAQHPEQGLCSRSRCEWTALGVWPGVLNPNLIYWNY